MARRLAHVKSLDCHNQGRAGSGLLPEIQAHQKTLHSLKVHYKMPVPF